jgi:uncharacterized protein
VEFLSMQGSPDSLTARWLRGLARWVCAHPRWSAWPHLLLVGLAVGFTVRHLEFSVDRNDLVGADKEYHRNFLGYKQEFQAQDELVVIVESEDTEKNRQFVERLGARLQAEPDLFTDILFNNDVKMLGDKALLFFPEDELETLRETLLEHRPVLQQFAQATNLLALFRQVNHQFRTTPREPSPESEPLLDALPALERIIRQAEDSLRRPGVPPSPGIAALFDARDEAVRQIYITFDEGRIFLLTARARTEALNLPAVERLRELVDMVQVEVPGVNAAITGESVLEFDEMAQSQRDTLLAGTVALVLVALVFIYGYRESGRPLKAIVCLVVGLAYTLAFATAAIGHLNILTITFVPMLVGLAIDFGIHLVTRYEEELRQGRTEHQAIETAMVHTGQGIFTGCFTTAGAFFAMALTDFRGIQEMGIICGGGLLICLVPMMTLLPALLLGGRQNALDHQHPAKASTRTRLEQLWLRRPALVLGLTALLCVLAWTRATRVEFDYNLLNLQTKDLPAVVLEQKLIESTDRSVLYGVVIAESLEEALELERRVKGLPPVASVDSMSRFLAEDQTRKLELVRAIKRDLADLAFEPVDTRPADIRAISATLWRMQGYLGLARRAAAEGGETELADQLSRLRAAIGQLRITMLAEDHDHAAQRVAKFQQALFDDVHETFAAIRGQDTSGPMRIDDLPGALRRRFISTSEELHLIQVYPAIDIWQRSNQEIFIHALRDELDPEQTGRPVITGTPVQLYEYTALLKDSYEEAAWYSLGAIALLVLIHFRSLICVALALVPVGIGTLWMAGIMGQFGQPFNPANIMTLPLVIGIGVTSGIHILNRFAEERSPGILGKSTGKAVMVAGLTTVMGFGSLMLAKHQGIASLGYVMAVGTTTCMLASLTVLPALLRLLGSMGWATGKRPSNQTNGLALGREEPR